MIVDTRKPRERWFSPPTTSEKLKRDKVMRLAEDVDDWKFIEAILNLDENKENETLVLPLIRYYIIPKELKKRKGKIIENPTSKDFKRYGENIPIGGAKTRGEAIRMRFDPQTELRKKLNNVLISKAYRGYGWWGISRQKTTHKHVPPTSSLDGYGMYVFFEKLGEDVFKSLGRPREKIIVRDYGQFCEVLVPSRTRGFRHSIRFDMLPTKNLQEELFYADWTEFRASETSVEDKRYREMSKRYVVPEIVFVDHTVAAYITIMDEKSKTQEPIRVNPFAVPTELAVRFDDNFTSKVVIEEGGRKRNPYEAERDIMLLKLCGYRNIKTADDNETPAYGSVFKGSYSEIEKYMVKIK